MVFIEKSIVDNVLNNMRNHYKEKTNKECNLHNTILMNELGQLTFREYGAYPIGLHGENYLFEVI